jgi:dTDP-4-dehydrorhamnose 3,5-epimerase-like enzyme
MKAQEALLKKLTVDRLPSTKEASGAKRWVEERGEFVQISHQEEIRHLAFFQIRKGYSRGSHYHEQKDEVFYVVDGRIRGLFRDIDTGEGGEFSFEKGDKIHVAPRLAHILYGLEETLVVEYSSQYFDANDSFSIQFPAPAEVAD